MDNTKEFTHISLCAGYGGIDLGLKRVIPNLRTIAFSEIEAYAVANLVSKIEAGQLDAAPIWSDLKTFPFQDFYGRVDILSGGFPCQPFSGAGRRGADEDPRHLFPHVMRGIRESAPKLVFLENVEGIYNSKLKGEGWNDPTGTPVLLHVLRELERAGYKATSGTFSAAETGAPHLRRRCFILAVKKGWSRDLELSKSIKQSVYPSKRGQEQYSWEPARTTNKTKPSMVRCVDGSADRLDYGELYESYDNITDELRLLGNGVVPDTATRAFRVLWEELVNSSSVAKG